MGQLLFLSELIQILISLPKTENVNSFVHFVFLLLFNFEPYLKGNLSQKSISVSKILCFLLLIDMYVGLVESWTKEKRFYLLIQTPGAGSLCVFRSKS